MSPNIVESALREGDVLLYNSDSLVSRAIQLLDGTDVSHASLYLGDGKTAEALVRGGLIEQTLRQSIEDCNWILARRLRSGPATMKPVLDRADHYLRQGNRYAYEQIVLLAVICLTRKPRLTPVFRKMVRAIIDAAAAFLNGIAQGDSPREPMICSEFVYRCYDEAREQWYDEYSLRIEGAARASALAIGAGAARPDVAAPWFPRGRGIDPDSLLAELSLPAASLKGMRAAPSQEAPAATRPAPVPAAVEALLQQYFEEVRHGRGPKRVAEEEIDVGELRAAVENLAWQYDMARRRAKGLEAAPVSGYGLRHVVFDRFLRTVADFVTPGDLVFTQSLWDVGKLR